MTLYEINRHIYEVNGAPLCECGCGKEVQIRTGASMASRGGEFGRFINHHNAVGTHYIRSEETKKLISANHANFKKENHPGWKGANRLLNNQYKCVRNGYGITEQQYDGMMLSQEGKCAICGHPPDASSKYFKKLVVDHSHKTYKTRGLLCRKCNSGIGLLHDDLKLVQRALDYLKRYE